MPLGPRAPLCDQIGEGHRQLTRQVETIPVCRRFMTAPGVGVVVALSLRAAIADPGRLAKAPSVGACLGLDPPLSSNEADRLGRITKRGGPVVRSRLYEAANVLLTRIDRFSARKLGASRSRSAATARRPMWRSPASWPSSCIGSGATAPSFRWGREAPLAA